MATIYFNASIITRTIVKKEKLSERPKLHLKELGYGGKPKMEAIPGSNY